MSQHGSDMHQQNEQQGEMNFIFNHRRQIGSAWMMLLVVSCFLILISGPLVGATDASTQGTAKNGFQSFPAFTVATSSINNAAIKDVDINERVVAEVEEKVEEETIDDPSTVSNNTVSNSNVTIARSLPEWKQRLPYPLNNKTKTLQRIIMPGPMGRCVEIYILGTAHISTDSSKEVKLLLETIQPNVIFLELCDQRIPMLLVQPPLTQNNTTTLNEDGETTKEEQEILEPYEERGNRLQKWLCRRRQSKNKKKEKQNSNNEAKSMYTVASSLLTNMQQDYADSLRVELGGEFRVAYNYWNMTQKERKSTNEASSALELATNIDYYQYNVHDDNRHVHMILGDRPLYLTMTRAWESLSIWGKMKLLFGLFVSSFAKPNPDEIRKWMESILQDDDGDLLSKSVADLAKHFPTLERVIIKERDAYMACKLYQICRQLLTDQAEIPNRRHRLVAIVGAGHIEGMCQWLTNSTSDMHSNGESPEEILSRLVQIKSQIPQDYHDNLVHDIMEVNPDLLQDMIHEIQQK